VAATDDEGLNRRLAARTDILVNVVDRPEMCSFIVPSSFSRGPMTVAVSTSGASPAMAREIRKDMEDRYGSAFGDYLRKLKAFRKRAMKLMTDTRERERLLKALASPAVVQRLLKGRVPALPKLSKGRGK
jgi:precorrin-2 dehydrogenase/sirohydrochlorin ferrochelatase